MPRLGGMGAAVIAGLLAVGGGAAASAVADGAGAEMPAAAYQAWCTASKLCTYSIRDSGAGIQGLKTGAADWAGVDEPLSPNQVRAAGGPVAYYPAMLEGIAVAAHLPGIDGHDLDLRGITLGEIFSGVVTNWNDKRIRATNARHPMPKDLPITLCVPARPSGTSWDFSHYLTKVSGEFRERVGTASMLPRWRAPKIIRTPHVTEVGQCVESHPGAITFLPFSDAMRENLAHDIVAVGKREAVTVRTRKGTRTVQKEVFMHPTTGDIQAAGHFAASRIGRDLTIDITNSRAKGAYPITVVTYTIVRKDKRMAPATRKTLRYFLSDDAQRMLTGLGYAPLPKSLLSRARAQLAAAR